MFKKFIEIKKRKSLTSREYFSCYWRGYSTIEMQLIRTVGLDVGSWKHICKRKIFELVYAQIVFNSYIRLYRNDKNLASNYKRWILASYVANVSVGFGNKRLFPVFCDGVLEKNTLSQLFNTEKDGLQSFSSVSDEHFFIWCLGLRCFNDGIGPVAIGYYSDLITSLELDVNKIDRLVASVMN